ncbi:outer membrane lipoprotein [Klebsiella pneumoniae subsp. pneumoniae]|nr:outer membrane lipoprotein [Klebsiella pneumoniae subsp. pneumoniae]
MPVFFYLKYEDVDANTTDHCHGAAAQRLRSIISRTVPGQGHGNQYYPGVQWDVRDSAWRYLTILDLPFSLVFDTLLLPLDASHGPYN